MHLFCFLLCSLMFPLFRLQKRTHEQARKLICAACGVKDFNARPVTGALELLIQEEVYRGYNKSDPYYPASLCGCCRNNLFKSKRNEIVPIVTRDKWSSMDYECYRSPSTKSPCHCKMCEVVRFHGESFDGGDAPDVPRKAGSSDENQAQRERERERERER